MIQHKRKEFSQDPLGDLDSLLKLGRQDMDDVIFVSIDFEGCNNIVNAFQNCRTSQVGFSILDTRHLRSWKRDQGPNLETLMKTSNFCTGSDRKNIEALRFFRFGITETISAYDIGTKIHAMINQFNEAGQARRIVLVGHGLGEDLKVLQALRISTKDPSILTILDTSYMAARSFDLREHNCRISLRGLAVKLGMPVDTPEARDHFFHSAGNDANITLRAMLLMAIRLYENREYKSVGEELDAQKGMVDMLREACLAEIPPRHDPEEVDRLIALGHAQPKDDPLLPIDASYFRIPRAREEVMARWKANWENRKAIRVESKKAFKAEKNMKGEFDLLGFRERNLNVPQKSGYMEEDDCLGSL